MDSTTFPVPAVYERRWFQPRVGAPDAQSVVLWVQGILYYCDARFALTNTGERTFYQAFAGRLIRHEDAADVEWEHAIAAGQAFGATDAGRLTVIEGWGLLETGQDLDYVELWKRTPADGTTIREFAGTDPAGRSVIFVEVGSLFGLALSADGTDGPPSSVHIGRREGQEWIAQHTTWATDPPPRFTVSFQGDSSLRVSCRTGDRITPPITFHTTEEQP